MNNCKLMSPDEVSTCCQLPCPLALRWGLGPNNHRREFLLPANGYTLSPSPWCLSPHPHQPLIKYTKNNVRDEYLSMNFQHCSVHHENISARRPTNATLNSAAFASVGSQLQQLQKWVLLCHIALNYRDSVISAAIIHNYDLQEPDKLTNNSTSTWQYAEYSHIQGKEEH